MNPFDGPPSSPPVSFDQPPGPPTEPVEAPAPAPEPRRGRMVAAVFATAAILGAAAFGVSELASADDDSALADESAPGTTDDATTDTTPDASAPADTDDGADGPSGDIEEPPAETPGDRPLFHTDGELRLDTGDGEPIIIDLGDLDAESLAQFTECIGLPSFDFGGGLPGLDPEQFDQFFEDFDPEQFDQFFEDFDPEQFDQFLEGFDPEQFQRELGPLFESDQFGDLFDQFFEDFDPELFDQFFDGTTPFGEHQAGRRAIERRVTPDFSGGSWFPSGLDREQIESCLAELD